MTEERNPQERIQELLVSQSALHARAQAWRQRAEGLFGILRRCHDHMHELTAIIPGNDAGYQATTALMTEIRALEAWPDEAAPGLEVLRRERDEARETAREEISRRIEASIELCEEIGSLRADSAKKDAADRVAEAKKRVHEVGTLAYIADVQAENRAALAPAAQGEKDQSTSPPPHWREKDGWERHPQTTAEWDWRQDGPDNNPAERSRLRLAFGADLDDPRAPDQMALVLRVDLSRVVSELVWRRAQVEMYQGKAPAPSAGGTVIVPREPTEAMLDAALDCWDTHDPGNNASHPYPRAIWASMIAAASTAAQEST